jgi:hypothetical protein
VHDPSHILNKDVVTSHDYAAIVCQRQDVVCDAWDMRYRRLALVHSWTARAPFSITICIIVIIIIRLLGERLFILIVHRFCIRIVQPSLSTYMLDLLQNRGSPDG